MAVSVEKRMPFRRPVLMRETFTGEMPIFLGEFKGRDLAICHHAVKGASQWA